MAIPPNQMTAEERRDEIVDLLAKGVLRALRASIHTADCPPPTPAPPEHSPVAPDRAQGVVGADEMPTQASRAEGVFL